MLIVSWLNILIVAVLVVSGLLVVAVERGPREADRVEVTRTWYRLYAAVLFLLLAGLGIAPYLGVFRDSGTPRLPAERQRTLEHVGFYAAPGEAFTFRGTRTDDGLYHPALGEGEEIVLTPEVGEGPRADAWTLRFDAARRPLRVDGRCVNLPASWWLDPGDHIRITRRTAEGEETFIELQWEAGRDGFWRRTNAYYFSHGRRTPDGYVYDTQRLRLTRRRYQEARNFALMLRLAPADFREAADLAQLQEEWWDVLRRLTWVREVRRDVGSRMGLLIHPELRGLAMDTAGVGLSIRRNGVELLGDAPPEAPLRLAPGARVSYGYGFQAALTLRPLPADLEQREGRLLVHTLDFARPTAWRLPPAPGEPFILTSAEAYIPSDGYVFNDLGAAHAFYAKGHVAAGFDSLVVNDGRRQTAYGLGEAVFMGDAAQGVRFRLQPLAVPPASVPLVPRLVALPLPGHPGRWAVALLFALTVGFVAVSRMARETSRVRLDLAWTLLWGLVLTLLVVRLIVAYRAGLLPPPDATPDEVRNVFQRSFRVSFQALFVVPAAMLAARAVVEYRRRTHRRSTRAFLTDYGRRARRFVFGWMEAPARQAGERLGGWLGTNVFQKIPPAAGKPILLTLLLLAGLGLWGLGVVWWLAALLAGGAMAAVWFGVGAPGEAFASWRAWTRARAREIWGLKVLFLPVLLWIAAGVVFGDGERLGLRISHGVHLIMVLSFAWALPKILAERPPFHWVSLAAIGFGLGLCLVAVGDLGFFIYGFSFAFFFLLLARWHRPAETERRLRLAQRGLVAGVVGLLLVFVAVLSVLSNPATGRVLGLGADPESSLTYRYLNLTDTQNDVLMAQSQEKGIDMDQLLRSAHQHWQMRLYAAEGRYRTPGFARAPLTDRGMTYPTSVTDCVYSVFVLGEHGPLAAWLLVVLFLGLAAALVYGGWFLEYRQRHRLLILFLIGAYLLCNALYMAFANLGLIIFTGQNIPLFSLYSGSDLLQNTVLLAFASALLAEGMWGEAGEAPAEALGERSHLLRLQTLLAGLGTAAVLLLAGALLGIDRSHARDHNFSRDVFDTIVERAWTYDPETGLLDRAKHDVLPLNEIEAYYKRQFEARANKEDENGGLYYVEPTYNEADELSGYRVRVNEHFFILRSPFSARTPWRGRLYAGGEAGYPVLATLGEEFRLRLSRTARPEYVEFGERRSVEAAGNVILRDRYGTRILELERDSAGVRLSRFGRWRVFHEGQPLEADTVLAPLDLVVLEDPTGPAAQTILYLGAPPPVLGTTHWRNGEVRHVYPEGGATAGVHTLMQAADWMAAQAARDDAPVAPPPDEVTLTLDVRLQKALQAVIDDYAASARYYGANDPLAANIIALAVLDSYSGAVRALPAWPYPDPAVPGFEERVRLASSSEQRRLLVNHNLRRHVVGSTIKPLVFSAVAAQLRERFDLAAMTVYSRPSGDAAARACQTWLQERGEPFTRLHSEVAGLRLDPCWDSGWSSGTAIDARTFFVRSLNYYQGLTGLLGLAHEAPDLDAALLRVETPEQADLSISGRHYRLDLSRLPVFHYNAEGVPIVGADVPETLLFRGLADLFPVVVRPRNEAPRALSRRVLGDQARRYVPFLMPGPWYYNEYLDEVVPEPVVLDPNNDWSAGSLGGDVMSFLLGGSINRWNNVDMAAAAARLATGRAVEARLEAPDSMGAFAELPWPLGDRRWRNRHLIAPMEGAGTSGTAAAILAGTRNRNPAAPRYRMIFKTGTLQEVNRRGPRSELLLFTVGPWEGTADDGAFVEGQTLSGYLYMQNARLRDDGYQRNALAPRLLDAIIAYLEERAGE